MLKQIIIFFVISLMFISLSAQTVIHTGTADKDVIAITIEYPSGNYTSPPQNSANWTVNGITPSEVGRYTYVWDQEKRFWGQTPEWMMSLRHHMYLKMPEDLISGTSYSIVVPGCGVHVLKFNEETTNCEAIKVNQVGYFGGSSVRYANFAIYSGDLGSHALPELPDYKVLTDDGTIISEGSLTYWGDDTNKLFATGEHIYRIDLSDLPDGGLYRISVAGYGCSYPFGVGHEYIEQLNNIHVRGLFHQRCGIALEEPFTPYSRAACHTTVEVTDAEPPDFISLRGTPRSIVGGHHDAGDFDRRLGHTLISGALLALYEAYPDGFTDNQYNIPESGNGVPDFLDEALFALKMWEELQESDGAIRAGTESNGHPEYGAVSAATDQLIYRTYKRYGHTTAIGAGLFAHSSRLLKPFDAGRSADLLTKAEAAWNYLMAHESDADMSSAHQSQKMYASLQLYLATGNTDYHDAFKIYANYCLTSGGAQQYVVSANLPATRDGAIFSSYFFSYLITEEETDPVLKNAWTQKLSAVANQMLYAVNEKPYPIGANPNFAWGSSTGQGRYAESMIMMYRLTSDNRYLDAVSQLADYSLGLNPLGRSYVTGIGSNPPNNICHLDSYYSLKAGKGVVPGIVVYGPIENSGTGSHLLVVADKVYPAFNSLPYHRRYTDGWSLIPATEFTTWETMTQNACMYGFLSSLNGGGTLELPESPSSLKADTALAGEIRISWEDKSNNESYFRIERKKTGSSYTLLTSVPANTTRFTDTNVTASTEYQYRIFAYNGMGNSGYSNEISVTTVQTTTPETPLNFSANIVSTNQIALSWADISKSESGFRLERKTGVEGSYSIIATLGKDVMNYSDKGLDEFTIYFYRIQSYNTGGSSEYSDEIEATTKKNFQSLSATVDDFPHTFDNLSNYAGGVDATGGYEIHDNGSTLFIYGNAALKADLRYLLTPGSILEFDFKSIDEARVHGIGLDNDNSSESLKTFLTHGSEIYWGNSDFNNYTGNNWKHYVIPVGKYYTGTMSSLFFMNDDDEGRGMGYFKNIKIYQSSPPIAPGNFSGTAISANEINLQWTDLSDNEEGFRIERKTGIGSSYSVIATTGADETGYTDTDLSSSSMYFYRISATSAAGASDYSEVNINTLSDEPGREFENDANTIGLWHLNGNGDDASGNGFHLTMMGDGEYATDNISWMETPEGAALKVSELNQYLTTDIPSTILWPGGKQTTLEFWIYGNAWKSYSIENFTIAGLNQDWDTHLLFFQGKWDFAPFITCNQEKKLADIALGEWNHIAIVYDGEKITYYKNKEFKFTLTTKPTIRSKPIKLILGNFDGYIDEVRVSDIARSYGGGEIPVAPSELNSSVISNNQIDLSWAVATGNELGFKLERKTGIDGEFSVIALLNSNVSNYASTGLLPGTTYYYRICAFNNAGDSDYSVETESTTSSAQTSPDAPGELSATVLSGSEIQLTWTDFSNNESWFKIERKQGSDGEYSQIGTTAAGVTSYKSSFLLPSTNYYYRVRAWNTGGDSEYSNEANETTIIATPSSLVATQVSEDQIDLTWNYIESPEDGIIIERKEGSDGTFAEIANTDGSKNNYSDIGLEQGIRYYYRIYAFSGSVNSAYSNTASAILINIINSQSDILKLEAYPNPFNNSTKIIYQLPATANVNLDIYDISGRKIQTLVNDVQDAGKYEIDWNITPGKIAEGIYLCKLTAKGESFYFTDVLRVMIMAK